MIGSNVHKRMVVVRLSHDFIKPWIRSYFSNGNTTPLLIVHDDGCELTEDDRSYCNKASSFSGGRVVKSENRVSANRKMSLSIKESIKYLDGIDWAWIDETVEVSGNIDECFDYSESAPGFVCAKFKYPSEIDNMHPMLDPIVDGSIKYPICTNKVFFFHGTANDEILNALDEGDFDNDDDMLLSRLYLDSKKWHDGFCDLSTRMWVYERDDSAHVVPKASKFICNSTELSHDWAMKCHAPMAPFERSIFDDLIESSSCDDAVDAVFVIGTGSADNNEELRYALRNLERNCRFIRDVYICGFCPQWVDKSVVKHLNWPDRFSHAKDANIIDKLRHACEHEGISKKILFCSDDQFQTHPCEWDDFYPRYLRKFDKGDPWYDNKRRVWHTRLKKTLMRDVERRKAAGLDDGNVFYYQPHMWMQVDRDEFIRYARWCNYENRDDTIIASGYFNFIDADGRPDADHVFLGNGCTGLPDATHIAYHDGSYKAAIGILRKMFPSKCRFERGCGRTEEIGDERKNNQPKNLSTGITGGSIGDFDPSKASNDEIEEILEVSSMIRENPVWNGLLSEMSRAEELRLFGVKGWRLFWRDLIFRWREDTKDGSVLVPVTSKRSEDASGVVNSYMSDPNSMRTIKFGCDPEKTSRATPSFGRQMPRTPPESVMSALRSKIRNSLRRWYK